MELNKVLITFKGMESTDPLKEYVMDKIAKLESMVDKAIAIDVILKENEPHRGVDQDYRIDINVEVPNSFIHVEEVGDDMYALIDAAVDILSRRYKRYKDKLSQWSGENPWKAKYTDKLYVEEGESYDDYNWAEYVPKIAVRKKIETMRPMDEAEAIEKMELMGYGQLLFKNKESGKISMVYKRSRGGYGLVEPEDGIEG